MLLQDKEDGNTIEETKIKRVKKVKKSNKSVKKTISKSDKHEENKEIVTNDNTKNSDTPSLENIGENTLLEENGVGSSESKDTIQEIEDGECSDTGSESSSDESNKSTSTATDSDDGKTITLNNIIIFYLVIIIENKIHTIEKKYFCKLVTI